MRKKRHSIIRVPWPPDFAPAAPTEIPPSLVFVPRIALGEAAAVAVRLNAQEMAKSPDQRTGWYLPVKSLDGCQPSPAMPSTSATN